MSETEATVKSKKKIWHAIRAHISRKRIVTSLFALVGLVIFGFLNGFFGEAGVDVWRGFQERINPMESTSQTESWRAEEEGVEDKFGKAEDFTDKRWVKWLGDPVWSFADTANGVALATVGIGADKGYKKFLYGVPPLSRISFQFRPHGENAANVVLNAQDFYEIIVGDNGYEAVSFKAHGDFIESVDYRPRLELPGKIKPGSLVHLLLTPGQLVNGDYLIQLEVSYVPAATGGQGRKHVEILYQFPSYDRSNKPLQIGIGVYQSLFAPSVSADFISFKVEE